MALCDFSFCFPSNNVSILESFLKKKKIYPKKYTYILFQTLNLVFGEVYSSYIVLAL